MRFELHCHSRVSDGALEPGEVARRALEDGARVFCLTDHDSTGGYPYTIDAGGDMRILRGLELSCHHERRSVHILVYDIAGDSRWDELEKTLEEVAEARRARVRTMAARLAERGIPIDAAGIIEGAAGKTIGRPDVAKALVEVGAVTSKREAFDRYLHDGGPIDVPTSRLGLAEGISLAARTGARLSLAHPHVHGPKRAAEIIAIAKPLGLSGLEAHYGFYGAGQVAEWKRLAVDKGLTPTGGSDFHEDVGSRRARLGVELDASAAHELADWLGIDL